MKSDNMKKIRYVILLLSLFVSTVYAYGAPSLKAMRNVIPNGYDFLMYLPDKYVKGGVKKPLFLFLHGASLCGKNLNRVRRYGAITALDRGFDLDGIVVAPQNPGGRWKPERLSRILDYMEKFYEVDRNRIYVLGMSLGGYGTLDFVGTYPERIAAAMAICGGTTLNDYTGLAQLPLWILHGTADRAVSIKQSRKIVDGIKKINKGELLMYSELKGIDHGRPARLFYRQETYNWLLKHRLDDRTVDRSFTITAKTVNEPYRIARKGKLSLEEPETEPENEVINLRDEVAEQPTKSAGKPVEKPLKSERKDSAKKTYHTIRQGDTFYALARKYGTTVQQICELNNMKAGQTLRLGKKLRVK